MENPGYIFPFTIKLRMNYPQIILNQDSLNTLLSIIGFLLETSQSEDTQYTFIHRKYMLSLQFTRLIYKHVTIILFIFYFLFILFEMQVMFFVLQGVTNIAIPLHDLMPEYIHIAILIYDFDGS